MAVRKMKALKALTMFLVFCFAQVYVQAGLGSPTGVLPQARLVSALLTRTTNGRPILINGNSSSAGQTVLTGATIETPDQAGATIDVSPLGSFDIGPNSKVQLDFSENGFRLNVMRGCVAVKSRGNDVGEAYTAEGASEKTSSNRRAFGVCYVNGQLSPGSVGGAAAAGGGGLTGGQWAAIVAGAGITAAVVIIATNNGRGNNPS